MAIWCEESFEDRMRFGLKIRRTLFSGQSEYQKVDVVETELFGKALLIDHLWMTSVGEEFWYHEMIAHVPLVSAPRIARVLVIGGGDGGTVREVLRHPEVEKVVMVEIDGMVIEASKAHLPEIGSAWDDPRLEVIVGDGIAYVKDADVAPFDVILVDGSDPVGPAEGLFNQAFFEGCARLLAPEGVLVTQSESPIVQRDVHVATVRLLRQVFGHAAPYYGPVVIYPSGSWSWTYATRCVDHLAICDERAERIEATSKVYNRDVHRGAFAIPNALRKELAP